MKHLVIGYSILSALLITIGFLVGNIIISIIFYFFALLVVIVALKEFRDYLFRKEDTLYAAFYTTSINNNVNPNKEYDIEELREIYSYLNISDRKILELFDRFKEYHNKPKLSRRNKRKFVRNELKKLK